MLKRLTIYLAFFTNTTQLSQSSTTPAGCAGGCYRYQPRLQCIEWSQPATITRTAATLVTVINNGTNSTRISTIINTALDVEGFRPQNTSSSTLLVQTNSAGTATTSFLLTVGSTTTTKYATFPTNVCYNYDSSYSIRGTVPTSVSGVAKCLTYDNYTGFAYPSHPSFLDRVSISDDEVAKDPQGLSYRASDQDEFDGSSEIESMFPSLGVWNCTAKPVEINGFVPQFAPARALSKVTSYLTATSTSIEAGSASAQVAPRPVPVSTPPAHQPTSEDRASSGEHAQKPSTGNNPGQSVNTPHISTGEMTSQAGDIIAPSATSAMPEPFVTMAGQKPGALPVVTVLTPTNPSDDHDHIITPAPEAAPTDDSSQSLSPVLPAAVAPPIITFGSQTITANAQGTYIIGDQTLVPGSTIAVQGTPISLNAGGDEVIINSITQSLSPQNPAITAPPALTLGAQIITPIAQGQYVIASQTLTPGGVITVSGTPISLATHGAYAVMGSSTQLLAQASAARLTLGAQVITPNAQGEYIIGSQTLSPGGAITVSGTPVSLASDGAYAVVGTSTESLSQQPVTSPLPRLTIGGQTITPNAQGQYIIGSQTLSPGDELTVSGTPVSLAPNGAYALVGTSTEPLHQPTTSPPPLTLGTQTITPNAQSQYIINGQTLTPGGVLTVSGTPISLAPNDAYAVIGTNTESLTPITTPPPLTLGTQTITPDTQGRYIIGNQTLTPGGAVTVSGTSISLGPQGTDVVVGTSTEGLGGIIMGGFGGGNGSATTGVVGFTGGAKGKVMLCVEGILMVVGVGVVLGL
ncbi:hypothetical protein ACLMJK_000467 [Lecanora helva]